MPQCGAHNQVIKIDYARSGQVGDGQCERRRYTYLSHVLNSEFLDDTSDSIDIMDSLCSGR